MKDVYQQTKQELFDRYGGPEGLSENRAKEMLQKYGENALEEKGRKSVLRIFLGQFADLLVIILMIAAVVSMLSGNVESTVVIFVVIVMNAVLGTVQYLKAEKSLDSLKALSSPHAKVLRDGKKMKIFSTTIYLWLISLTASKELSILLLKLYNDGAIGISSLFLDIASAIKTDNQLLIRSVRFMQVESP